MRSLPEETNPELFWVTYSGLSERVNHREPCESERAALELLLVHATRPGTRIVEAWRHRPTQWRYRPRLMAQWAWGNPIPQIEELEEQNEYAA